MSDTHRTTQATVTVDSLAAAAFQHHPCYSLRVL